MKKLYIGLMAALLTFTSTANVFAYSNKRFVGLLIENNEGCVYKKDNGEYARNEWVNVNYEGRSLWYYIAENTHPISATISPDGYKINFAGHWIDERDLKNFYDDFYDYDMLRMFDIVEMVFHCKYNSQETFNLKMNVKRENLTSEDKAFLTYAYINEYGDYRLTNVNKGYEPYKVASKENIMAIMKDLTGSSNESDMQAFAEYATIKENKYWVMAVGEVGDPGRACLSENDLQLSIEGNRVKITGDVLIREGFRYIPARKFNAYFTISDSPDLDFVMFDELLIQ